MEAHSACCDMLPPKAKAVNALKSALVNQFGESARSTVESEVASFLQGRTLLVRDDLDAIEDGILHKLRQQRQQGRSTSLPRSLGCAGPRPLTTRNTSQSSKGAHLQMSSTAPQLGLRTLPKPILQKPQDCFDLWREYDTIQHVSEEVEKKRQKQDKAEKYRQALDLQMKQAQAQREAEDVEKRQDRANMLAEMERAQSAATEELQKQLQKKEMLKEATAQQLVRAERHKRSAARRALRDQEAMDRTLELEEQFRQQELMERQRRRAVESQLMKTQFDMSQAMQERMKREEKEEDTQRALEWMRATSRPQDAELPGGMLHKIRENQKRVDTLVGTIGVAMVERQRAQDEALDLTIDRNYRAYEKKQTADFFAKKAERRRQAKELFVAIKQQAAEKRERGWEDKEADRWQAAAWRQQDADFAESQRLAAERTLTARKEMDANLFGAMLAKAGAHKMEQGVSDKTRHRELLLNRPLVQRMAQSGFKPEKTVAMLQQASAQKEP